MNALIAIASVLAAVLTSAAAEYAFDTGLSPYWQVLLAYWDVLCWWCAWVSVWALLERIFAGRFDWAWHAAVAGVGLLGLSVLWSVVPTLAYGLGHLMPDLWQQGAAIGLIGVAVVVHLSRIPPGPRLTRAWRVAGVAAFSVIACAVLVLQQPNDVQAKPELAQVPPTTWMLRQPVNTPQLLRTLNAMQPQVEAGRLSPLPDGLL